MSDENVETARRWLEALSSEDFEAAIALVHPDVELVPPGGHPPYRGADSMRRWMEPDAFEAQEVTPVEIIVTPEGTILARQHLRARGAGSGIELEGHSWSVWTFDEAGLITRIEIYLEHEEDKAREAAGLSD
ncbi:MAG TPA: nuclear transport factor 2 family protein [Solirubrobacterales bacterium]|nr:nuclear transport factor 2 family protein [Solirubrobacterales bacterium]